MKSIEIGDEADGEREGVGGFRRVSKKHLSTGGTTFQQAGVGKGVPGPCACPTTGVSISHLTGPRQ